jgi:hypothetical protein
MSEQEKPKSFFMEELDRWTESNVIGPLFISEPGDKDWDAGIDRVKKAIRTKVLESFRNGQATGPRQPRQPAVEQRRKVYQR